MLYERTVILSVKAFSAVFLQQNCCVKRQRGVRDWRGGPHLSCQLMPGVGRPVCDRGSLQCRGVPVT